MSMEGFQAAFLECVCNCVHARVHAGGGNSAKEVTEGVHTDLNRWGNSRVSKEVRGL